jgi:cell division protein FtsA
VSKGQKISVLDIAGRKIVCVIASINGDNIPKVVGFGHHISEGIKAGIIIDIKKAEKSILAALNAAERMANETIEEAYVNISGSNIKSQHINIETKISGHEVTAKDIDLMVSKGVELFENSETEIIQSIPLTYRIDDTDGIKDPIGMFGQVISTNLHVVTASATSAKNLRNLLGKCHLNITDFVVSSYASGIATLSQDEMDIGVTLLDIGANNTSIAIFADGYPVYFDSVPVGGAHITRDIALGLSVSIPFAERLKVIHGSAIATESDDVDRIDLADDEEGNMEKSITKSELTSIIKPRVEEIIEMAKSNLEKSGLYSVSGNKVVITGGSSQLQGIREICSYMFNKHTRIAKPVDIIGMPESAKGPAFSASIGMLLHAAKQKEKHESRSKFNPMDMVSSSKHGGKGFWLIDWFKRNF